MDTDTSLDTGKPGRIGSVTAPLTFKVPQDQFRAVRSATTLVARPTSYSRGIGMLMQLLLFKGIAHRAKQLLYAAIESSGNLIMQGRNAGKVEVDEGSWRNLVETAIGTGSFSEHQVRNMNAWLKYDWTTILRSKTDSTAAWSEGAPMRLRLAETVLAARTNRFSIVLESLFDDYNQQAVIRTADCFGIQNVHSVASQRVKLLKDGVSTSITKKVLPYMTLHQHETTTQCIEALRSSGHEIWATDLSPGAVKLDSPELVIPEKLAIVFGRELDGCSQEILKAADKRVFIPIFGFAESLNLSVAASLVMQTLFTKCPEARGNLTQAEKAVLREKWYMILGRNSEAQRERFRSFLTNPPEPLDDIRRMDKTTLATGAVRDKMRREAPSSPTEILEDPLMDLTGTASASSSPPAAKKPKIEENIHL